MGPELYGVKWRHFQLALTVQKYLTDPAGKPPFPHLVNLIADAQEREPLNLPYLHSWTAAHSAWSGKATGSGTSVSATCGAAEVVVKASMTRP